MGKRIIEIITIMVMTALVAVAFTGCTQDDVREHVLEPVNIRIENNTGKALYWSVVEGDVTEAGAYSFVNNGFHDRTVADEGATFTVFVYANLGNEIRIDGVYKYEVIRITPIERVTVNVTDSRNVVDVRLSGESLAITQTKTERIYE